MIELKIILIIALLQYLYYFIFKPNLNQFNCGIFGQATKSVGQINMAEINILGIQNVERGKNSCGITYDGDILIGIDKEKIYTDFIKGRHLKAKNNPVVFGHTRQSSNGTINIHNAHPFGFGDGKNSEFEFIGCHNGTLKNHIELAKTHDVDMWGKYRNEFNVEVNRYKIDSEIILEILWKTKSYKVLSEYNGGAALVWTWCNEPNKVYLWAGASRKDSDDAEDKIFEERPLFVYTKGKNNTYFSSLSESLEIIGGVKENIKQIDYNTVYIVTDGDFNNAEKIKVSRRKAFQNEVYTTYSHTPVNNTNYIKSALALAPINRNGENSGAMAKLMRMNKEINKNLNIYDEKPLKPINEYGKKIYYNKLRYWRAGHLITGIYTYIKDFGFFKLGETSEEAKKTFYQLCGCKFDIENGEFDYFDKIKNNSSFIPFKLDCKEEPFFYFIQGVQLRTFVDYNHWYGVAKNLGKNEIHVDFLSLSYCSINPIIDISVETKLISAQSIYLNGRWVSDTFCPLGSEKIYTIKEGNLIMIQIRQDIKFEIPIIELPINFTKENDAHNPEILKKAQENIIELEKDLENFSEITQQNSDETLFEEIIEKKFTLEDEINYNEDLDSAMNTEDIDNSVEEIINEGFANPLGSLNILKNKLEKYLPNKEAKAAIENIKAMVDIIQSYIIIETRENE